MAGAFTKKAILVYKTMKIGKTILFACILIGLVGCSYFEQYAVDMMEDAGEILDKVKNETDPVYVEQTKKQEFEKQKTKETNTNPTCLQQQGICEEVGNRYLSQLGGEAYYILEGPISENTDYDAFFEPIISYLVDGSEIKYPVTETDSSEYDYFIYDEEEHKRIWRQIDEIMPREFRDMLKVLIFYTDGEMNYLASVEPTVEDPREWILNIDIKDMDDPYIFINTIVHEYGHLITLNDNQVETIMDYYLYEDEPLEFLAKKASCHTYFTDFGCAREDSYIHAFYDEFWYGDIEDDWYTVDLEDEWAVYDFFERHDDEFLHDYAAMSIYEDIAESWTYFVFSERISNATEIWEKKVNFFYNYPELVELRAEILRDTYNSLHY